VNKLCLISGSLRDGAVKLSAVWLSQKHLLPFFSRNASWGETAWTRRQPRTHLVVPHNIVAVYSSTSIHVSPSHIDLYNVSAVNVLGGDGPVYTHARDEEDTRTLGGCSMPERYCCCFCLPLPGRGICFRQSSALFVPHCYTRETERFHFSNRQ